MRIVNRLDGFRRVLALVGVPLLVACAAAPPPIPPVGGGTPRFEDRAPNRAMSPDRAKTLLEHGRLEVVSERYAGRGVTGASRMEVRFPDDGGRLTVKWKSVPPGLDRFNNSPRREIAAYAVQRLVLDPEDFVVPLSVLRCLTAEELSGVGREPSGRVDSLACELGVFSVWLEDVTVPSPLFDPARFGADPVYAHYLANFNLLTYLIRHKDGRDGNFLAARDPERPIVFSVDNGVAWSGRIFNWFVPNWDEIRVPALRRRTVDRLRTLDRSDLLALGVVAQLEVDDDGVARPSPPGANFDPRHGARRSGRVIQLGLTRDEIEELEERIEELLEKVDEGEIQLFGAAEGRRP